MDNAEVMQRAIEAALEADRKKRLADGSTARIVIGVLVGLAIIAALGMLAQQSA